jgi:DNA-binding MarR family transcriptional regulator
VPETKEPLGRLLTSAVGAFIDEMHRRLAGLGHPDLRPVHGFVFKFLSAEGATTAQIGAHLGMSKQGAAKVVTQMTALGYVTTVTDPDDGRARPVVVTAAGRRAMALAATIQRQLESELARSTGRADVDATRRVMELALRRWAPGDADSATAVLASVSRSGR